MKVITTQLCVTICDPMDRSPLGSLCPRDFPGKNTGVSSHFLLQEIFLTQGSNPGLLHCRHTVYHLSQEERCYICKIGGYICKIKNLLIACEECETKICSSLHSCQYRPGQCDPGSHTGVTFLGHHESHPYKWRN